MIELHTLRTLGVSSLNRGENGEVKTCIFGDILRSRISSQAIKAAIRKEFGETFRTRVLIDKYLIPKCQKEYPEQVEEFEALAKSLLSLKKGSTETGQIMVYTKGEAEEIYRFILQLNEKEKEEILGSNKEKLKEFRDAFTKSVQMADLSLEVAIFGRMSTDGPVYTIPSAVHFNHPISIDQHHREEDFFTAFDNLKEESGHLSASEFTSATMYSYMNIDPVQVYENLMLPVKRRSLSAEEYEKVSKQNTDMAIYGVAKVAELMLQVMPSGKQNSMATYPLPSIIYATIDDSTYPCTLESCFSRIIRCYNDKSVVSTGAERMMNYAVKTADTRKYRAFFIDSNLQEELSETILQEVKEEGILCGGIRQRTDLFEEIRSQAAEMIEDSKKKIKVFR